MSEPKIEIPIKLVQALHVLLDTVGPKEHDDYLCRARRIVIDWLDENGADNQPFEEPHVDEVRGYEPKYALSEPLGGWTRL
jgi:hypothetical protein